MTFALSRLSALAAQFAPSSLSSSPAAPDPPHTGYQHRHHIHQLSPTAFLPRAAAIEPDACAVYHTTSNGKVLRRTYRETADRARGLAYYIRKHGYKRTGILSTNTPAFLEAIFGIGAAGGVNVAINYRLKKDDIEYIFGHADVDSIIVDDEVKHLLEGFVQSHPEVKIIVDLDTDVDEGPYDEAVLEGLRHDEDNGSQGWGGLQMEVADEEGLIALAYTSGTTARPKGVEYTHRSSYIASIGNVIESGLNTHNSKAQRCHYLWTLPMFHAMGWTFPWAVTAVRGTHYCLRKIDYPQIWRLLKDEHISHYNSAPTVNTLLCADPNAEKLPEPVRVTVAASPPTAHLFETMESLNLHPVHVYGLTETYGPITKGYFMPSWDDLPAKEKYARMARQGHGFIMSLPVRVIKTIEDESASGHGGVSDTIVDVKKNGTEIGEIVFIGNICAKGYYKDEAATRKLFAGGVLHSGDLAVCHPDGAIQILDRAKDIIISGGENISSLSVESLLVTHPDILEAACVAVPHEKWGETPRAFITVREGKAGTLTGDDVIDWAKNKSNISRFMVPTEVDIVSELPKTSTGKLRKNVLREWAKGGKRDLANW
ncbi:acetyl-CoA synthetase-like protein [Polychaeton citri CBS 116435]|uniref:Acetyl-CoA synthetase-like protein n=1 Tax=Polychaeton citri CBS 116435 TaxID=1314669 RepID=A0A9P4Q2L3_9PEZI|nr:acetyl-CoA synthetase-like protein [Polychaeton citri CBS 116435]